MIEKHDLSYEETIRVLRENKHDELKFTLSSQSEYRNYDSDGPTSKGDLEEIFGP